MTMISIHRKQRTAAVVSAFTAVLLTLACLAGPDDRAVAGPPWNPVDSAWKVIDNLELAYNTMDLDLYMSCFREDFEFHLPFQWGGGYGKQDSFWGYWLEEEFHQGMFNCGQVYSIDLQIEGTNQTPWTGDSTGASLQLNRAFSLYVYLDESQSEGYLAAGEALFICRKDSTGEWYVWKWWDQSQT